ncbi:hypothetical protein LINPERPRIM_LOCUS2719 [Linum perenne]
MAISSKSSTRWKPSVRETPPSASAAPTPLSSASRRNPQSSFRTPGNCIFLLCTAFPFLFQLRLFESRVRVYTRLSITYLQLIFACELNNYDC